VFQEWKSLLAKTKFRTRQIKWFANPCIQHDTKSQSQRVRDFFFSNE